MQTTSDLSHGLDLSQIVADVLSTRNRLLPPPWGDVALREHAPDVTAWLRSAMRRDFNATSEEVVLARKLGRGARPLSLMGLRERLIYRAAVAQVELATGATADRSRDAHQAFLRAPLDVDGIKYVFKTDIAAYYQYIDHERMVDEVVAQGGDDLAVTAAVTLLGECTGRTYGLPQLNPSSDVLAEIYIDPVRRTLIRSGFTAFRFADDFRVACSSYDEALAAWEAADEAARDLGLVLNEWKTATPRRERYERSLTAIRDQERELFAALDVDELEEPEYWDSESTEDVDSLLEDEDFEEGDITVGSEAEPEEPTVSEEQLHAAEKVLERWVQEEEDDETQRREEAQVTAALLGRALRVFGAAGSSAALENLPAILVYEPSLTPTAARYLRRIAAIDRRAARDALDEICASRITSAWQAVWIAYVAGELKRRRGGDDLPHVLWLRAQLFSRHEAVAAESALALARRHLISSRELNDVFTRIGPVHRPTLVVALGAAGDLDAQDVATTRLDRLRIAWAAEHL